MSPEKQRVAIATACGWKCAGHPDQLAATGDFQFAYQFVINPNGEIVTHYSIPDYLNDLNACHEAEKVLTDEQTSAYITTLCLEVQPEPMLHHATAPQRCEAFLRTLGLWEEDGNTTKSVSPTSPVTEQADHETAEQKVAWLTEILVTKSCDPVFADYWLRLARRNLLLGLPLKTEEPDLNLATEESSATQPLPLYICEDCNHEWDNDKWYCVACNHTQYRIPNPARNDEPNRLSCPTQPNQ